MIRAENITFRVEGRSLVSDLNLSVVPGKLTGILGPNGAGKSTLLKMLCGQIAPTSGRILLEGKPLPEWAPRELARRRAVLPQQSTIPFQFTALEIVLLGRAPHGDAARNTAMALEAMKWTTCDHLATRIVGTLSGGELQRVHLARVLVQIGFKEAGNASYLLLDEPISNLDPAHQHGTLQIARELAAQGVAVLIVLHDLNIAAQYSDELVMMKDGRIRAAGAPRDVMTADIVGEIFSVSARIVENPVCAAPAVFVEDPRVRSGG